MQVVVDSKVPTGGEWVLSPLPNKFTVTLINDTGLFEGYDRIALMCRLGDRVGDGDAPGKSMFEIGIQGARSLIGENPDENLDKHPDIREFCAAVQSRITEALNLWADTITDEQKMNVWLLGNENPLDLLSSLSGLSSK